MCTGRRTWMAWMLAARIAHVAACHRLAKDPATNSVHICHTELQQRILLAKPGASNHCLVDLCLLLLVCRHARPKHVFSRHTWGCTRDIYNTVRSKRRGVGHRYRPSTGSNTGSQAFRNAQINGVFLEIYGNRVLFLIFFHLGSSTE